MIFYEEPRIKIYCGDALEQLKLLADKSVDCCITSPPYWGLRDYGTAKWEGGNSNCDHKGNIMQTHAISGRKEENKPREIFRETCNKCGAKRIDNQLGLEKTPELYVTKMVEVFREVKRVLKKEGTLWLNLGDSYSYGGRGCGGKTAKQLTNKGSWAGQSGEIWKVEGVKPKQLIGIPWRVAFALQADGWYLRQDIIWAKPNPMPESITDRCTKSHEYIFLLAKSQKYYFDKNAISEPAKQCSIARLQRAVSNENKWVNGPDGQTKHTMNQPRENYKHLIKSKAPNRFGGADHLVAPWEGNVNKRSVWTITTQPFKGAHFATFPEDLVLPCILAGTSEKGICPECGKAWEREVKKEWTKQEQSPSMKAQDVEGNPMYRGGHHNDGLPHKGITKTFGWQSTCKCDKEPVPATVLDPFSGSGTVGVVAKKNRRNAVLIDLNLDYCKTAAQRIKNLTPPLF